MDAGSFLRILLSPLAIAALHALLSRVLRRLPRQLVAGLAGVIIAIAFPLGCHSTGEALYTLACVLLFTHLYFHVFNMSETARRIRILVEWKMCGRATDGYDTQAMVRVRIQRLVDLGQISLRGDRYLVRPSLLARVARFLVWHERMMFPHRES
jgi:hypothetical protein